MRTERITGSQLSILIFYMIISTVTLFAPAIIAQEAQQSSWLVPIIASGPSFISLWAVVKLGRRFPRLTLPQYSELIFGKVIGKLFALGFGLFLFVLNVLVVREFADFMSNTVLTQTPLLALSVILLIVSGYAALEGIEVIARVSQFILPLTVAVFLIMLFLAIPDLKICRLYPVFEHGWRPILRGSIIPASWFGEIVILAMIMPMVNKLAEVKVKALKGLLATIFLLTASTLVTLLTIGPLVAQKLLFPYIFLVSDFPFGTLFQRIDTVLIIFWITGIIIKAAILLYLNSLAFAQIFSLKSHKPVLLPIILVQSGAATYFVSNTLQLNLVLTKYWPLFGLAFEIGLPLFILTLAWLRNKRGEALS